MAFFNKQAQQAELSERDKLLKRYNGARSNIMLVVVFSLVNVFLLATGSDTYFLFSASIPYYITFFGLMYTGKMPADFYEGAEGFEPLDGSFFVIAVVLAAVVIGLYALSWFLSKKHGYGWVVFSLIFFVIDTFAMFYLAGFSSDMLFDFVFHIWVVVSLFSGVMAAIKIKDLPEEELVAEYQPEVIIENGVEYAPVIPEVESVEIAETAEETEE